MAFQYRQSRAQARRTWTAAERLWPPFPRLPRPLAKTNEQRRGSVGHSSYLDGVNSFAAAASTAPAPPSSVASATKPRGPSPSGPLLRPWPLRSRPRRLKSRRRCQGKQRHGVRSQPPPPRLVSPLQRRVRLLHLLPQCRVHLLHLLPRRRVRLLHLLSRRRIPEATSPFRSASPLAATKKWPGLPWPHVAVAPTRSE